MNKRELATKLAVKLENISIKYAEELIDAVFEAISEGLNEDGKVTLGRWGTYEIENSKIESKIPEGFTGYPGPKPAKTSKKLTGYPGPKPTLKKLKISSKVGKIR